MCEPRSNVTVDYAGALIHVRVDPSAAGPLSRVWSFFRPHVAVVPVAGPTPGAALTVEVLPYAAWTPRDEISADDTLIRKSPRRGNHVWGRSWVDDGSTTLHIAASETVLVLYDDAARVRIHLGEHSWYHVSDFLRDVLWELAAARGTFVHAAAVSGGHGVVAFVGDKGAGKTTTAVDFMRAGASFFTGDALYMPHGSRECYGFPDYPNVGWGTLRDTPDLYDAAVAAGREPGEDTDKVLLPYDIYETALGASFVPSPLPLVAVVLPQVSAPGAVRLVPSVPASTLEPGHRRTTDPDQGWEPFLRRLSGERRVAGAPVLDDVRWFARQGLGRPSAADIARVMGADGT